MHSGISDFSPRELPDQVDPGSPRRSNNGSCINCTARLEKGAVVILACSVLVSIALCNQIVNYSVAMAVMTLTFPVAGWIADTWIGRYTVLRTAMHLLLLSSALTIFVLVFLIYYIPSEIVSVLKTVLICIAAAGMSCYAACSFQFATDQMIGASSDQLSFTIHWLLWGFGIGLLINNVIYCVYLKTRWLC